MAGGRIQNFIGINLSCECIGLLIRVRANPGIPKSNCVSWLDWRFPVCSTTSAQWYLEELKRQGFIENRSVRDISHLYITDKGEQFLYDLIGFINKYSSDAPGLTWDECMENARIKEGER